MKFDRYEVVKELGKGAMGVVYQAHDPNIDRLVALKAMRPDRVTSEEFKKRFFKEAKAIGRLSHPNIVTIYDVGKDQGTVYIAMEFLEGEPLNEVMQERHIPLEEVIDIGAQVAHALDYAHGKGIVHRDIKPPNIILNRQGRVILTDFGIARIEDLPAAERTRAGEILGTPVYMSPEQVMGKSVDGRSDLYSLAVILYELVTERRPFSGKNIATIFKSITLDTPEPPEDINPQVPDSLSDVILKNLSKEAEYRHSSGLEFARALKACVRDLHPPAEPVKQKKNPVAKYAMVGVIVLALAIGGAVAYRIISQQTTTTTTVTTTTTTTEKRPVAQTAVISVESDPVGAEVFVNGDFVGKTPLNVEVALGKYDVKLSLDKYFGWEAQLQLTEAGETPLFVQLIPMEE